MAMNNRVALANVASKAPSKMKSFFKDILKVLKDHFAVQANVNRSMIK
jgi:hypothetical protein